jgi:hypothetical protein
VYQIAHTALAWASLNEGETIYLEQAEDFDRHGRANEAVQIKDLGRPITLRTPAVREFICNAWLNRERNPQRNVRSRLLTTALPTMEQGTPFPKPGIDYWRETAGKEPNEDIFARVTLLSEFIQTYSGLPDKMSELLQRANPLEILDQIITPVTFDVGSTPIDSIERALQAQLTLVATMNGFLLNNIENALNATLKAVWDTVRKSDERALNPGMLIDVLAATTTTIPPKTGSQSLEYMASAATTAFTSIAIVGSEGIQLTLAPVLRELPPLSRTHLERTELVEAASLLLQRSAIAIISGPRYVGKSTLASDIAWAQGERWAWVDANSNSPMFVRRIGAELTDFNGQIRGIVIDGVSHCDPSVAVELAHLLKYCRDNCIRVVIVPDREFSAPIKQRLGIEPEMELLIDNLSRTEIARFLLSRGCPEALVQKWTRALELATAGSPVLVIGRIANIERAGFPEPGIDDICETRPEINHLRRDIRLVAAGNLEAAQFEMLNRMSISHDAYSRPVALRLAAEKPAISAPGNALDALIGSWVKEVAPQRYQVIDLAYGFGSEAHGGGWAARMHRAVARAILGEPSVTTVDAAHALSHAFTAQDRGVALAVLHQVIFLEGALLDSFAQAASWLPFCYTDTAKPPEYIPKDKLWILRAAQMRIGAQSDGGIPQAVIRAFDVETPSESANKDVRTARLLVLSEMLMRSQMAGLSMSQIARYSFEWAELVGEAVPTRTIVRLAQTVSSAHREGSDREAALFVLGFSALRRVKTTHALLELLTAVSEYGSDAVRHFFGMVNEDRQLSHSFLFPLSSCYIGADGDEWREAADALVRFAEGAFRLGLETVSDEAAAGAIRLIVELSSTEEALSLAERLGKLFQGAPSISLHRAKARALMMDLQYGEATRVWSDLLPGVAWDGTDFDLYADYRDAAIGFARMENWLGAAEMLQEGAARLDRDSLGKWKAAMELDAAAALFRAKQFEAAVAPMLRACDILATVEIDASGVDYMIMKRMGHTVFWMVDPRGRSDNGYDAPPAAFASWLNTTHPPIDLAPTEVDMLLAMASDYAYLYGSLDEARSTWNRTLQSPHSIARVQAHLVAIFVHAEMGDGPGLVSSLANLGAANSEVERQSGAAPPGWAGIAADLFAFGLIIPGLQNRIGSDFLSACWQKANEAELCEEVLDVIEQAQRVFVDRSIDPRTGIYDAGGTLRILLSIAFAASLADEPEAWIRIHALWVELALKSLMEPAGAFLYRLICERWAALVHNHVVLSRPAVTAPTLSAALASRDLIWNRLADILVAAAGAAGAVLPKHIREALDDKVYNVV